MGLDMYLTKRTYVKNWDHMQPEEKTVITVLRDGKPLPGVDINKISEIVEEVAYWRKANAIHAWFVKEVQEGNDNCQDSYVAREQLKELVDLCKLVLDKPKLALTKLPPQSGFFFGGTDIDEYYLEDLKMTVKMLEPCVADEGGSYYYHASW